MDVEMLIHWLHVLTCYSPVTNQQHLINIWWLVILSKYLVASCVKWYGFGFHLTWHGMFDVSNQILHPMLNHPLFIVPKFVFLLNSRLLISKSLSTCGTVEYIYFFDAELAQVAVLVTQIGINYPLHYSNTCTHMLPDYLPQLEDIFFAVWRSYGNALNNVSKTKVVPTPLTKLLKFWRINLTCKCRHSMRFKSWLVRPREKWLVIWWHLLH